MDSLSHLGSLVKLESLRLGVTVYRKKGYKPADRVPHDELERQVWGLIRGTDPDATSRVPRVSSGSVGAAVEPASEAGKAAALRTQAKRLIEQAEQLMERAAALMKRAAELSR